MTKSNPFVKNLKNINKSINSLLERNLNKLKFDNLKIVGSNNIIILTVVALFILFVSYILIPTFYKQSDIKRQLKNELLIFWNIGIKKIKFINTLVTFSLFFLVLQLILNTYIVPRSLDQAREFVRNSNIDFFPNLIKEKKFIAAVESLTIFVEKKEDNGELQNIYLKDSLNDNQSQIIYAKKGKLIFNNQKNHLKSYVKMTVLQKKKHFFEF